MDNNAALMGWVWVIVIGILAGFIAGKIMRGKGFGMIVDLLLGIVGAWLGGYLFGVLGLTAGGLIGRLLMSVIGAMLLLFLIRLIKKA
jgi:uncharacterized membrane protein YeaQ/YmgE (transglycosylase-associated protein family)